MSSISQALSWPAVEMALCSTSKSHRAAAAPYRKPPIVFVVDACVAMPEARVSIGFGPLDSAHEAGLHEERRDPLEVADLLEQPPNGSGQVDLRLNRERLRERSIVVVFMAWTPRGAR